MPFSSPELSVAAASPITDAITTELATREALKQKRLIDAITMQGKLQEQDLAQKKFGLEQERAKGEAETRAAQAIERTASAEERRARIGKEQAEEAETRRKTADGIAATTADDATKAALNTSTEFRDAYASGKRKDMIAAANKIPGLDIFRAGKHVDEMLKYEGTAKAAPAPPHIGSFEDYVVRQFGESPTPQQIEGARKKWGDEGRATKVTIGVGGPSGFSPPAIDSMALALVKGDKQALAGLGWGSASMPAKQAAWNRMTYYDAATGTFGGVPQVQDIATNRAIYASQDAELRKETVFNAATKRAARTANANADLVLKASPNVSRTDVPFINTMTQRWQRGFTSAPGLTDFEVKIYTFAREYAKVVSGSAASIAGLTDTAAKEASALFNAAQTPESLKAAIEAAQADMDNVIGQSDANVKGIQEQIRHPGGSGSSRTGEDDPLGLMGGGGRTDDPLGLLRKK